MNNDKQISKQHACMRCVQQYELNINFIIIVIVCNSLIVTVDGYFEQKSAVFQIIFPTLITT